MIGASLMFPSIVYTRGGSPACILPEDEMSHLLTVRDLSIAFSGDQGESTFVDDVSFHVDTGETVCIVGESGCGKSITVLSIMGLLGENGRVTGGKAEFEGRDLISLGQRQLDKLRGNEITMIFQDAMTSLNPVFTIGSQLTESIRTHLQASRQEAFMRAEALLEKVGLSDPKKVMKKYPHTLSGGMRQRVMIATALCCNPKLLIADEPTTALDVTIQAQIMQLLKSLQHEYHMSILLITHDMGLVAEMADRVLVMYAGQVVEESNTASIFSAPRHPYTQALLQSVPSIKDQADRRLQSIHGTVPERYQDMAGCRFFNRCPMAKPECEYMHQALTAIAPGHSVRCWIASGQIQEAKERGMDTGDQSNHS